MIKYLTNLVGLRTLKTALSVTLCIVIANILRLEYPFFVGMTAIFAMGRTMHESFFMSLVRVGGTLIGAATGICMSYISRGNPILIFIGIIFVIVVCNKCNLQAAIPISGIVFLWIMVHVGDASPLFYGMHRVFDSFIGAAVSCSVNLLLPPYHTDTAENEAAVCE
ncbi:MAG: aromatic acid exporter family protein [Angelakisella sp.]